MINFGAVTPQEIPPVFAGDPQEIRERFQMNLWRPKDHEIRTRFQARKFKVAEFIAKANALRLRTPNAEA